ncbi:MAG: DUF2927 domain-containing protein [Magnetococcales bacterium]|nr:DUF2927 domain-containing protein [Magnetococcales bacterium]
MLPLFFQPHQAQGANEEELNRLTRFFETVVFGSEEDPRLASRVIAKWRSRPITVAIQGRLNKHHGAYASAHLTRMAKWTGLRFKQAKKSEIGKADLHLLFVRRKEMQSLKFGNIPPSLIAKLGRSGGCYFISMKKPPSKIVKAFIVVNIERDDLAINACLLEEIAQSLGLPNDTNIYRPSIFSDLDRLTVPSPQDEILIRTLYDPKLRAGMPRTAAMKQVRELIQERLQRP